MVRTDEFGTDEKSTTEAREAVDREEPPPKESLTIRLGRPWRQVRGAWNRGKLSARTIVYGSAALLLVPELLMLRLLLSGTADGWTPETQAWFVLALLATSAYLASTLWVLLKSRTRHAFHIVMGLVVLSVLLLACVGFLPYVETRVPWLTQIYWGLLLLVGNNVDVWDGGPESLVIQVAQYAGVTVLFMTVFRVLATLGSAPLALFRATLSPNIILMTGLNTDSLRVLKALTERSEGALVLVVEPDSDHPLLAQVRTMGARVVTGSISNRPSDRRWLTRVVGTGAFRRRVALRRAYLLGEDERANVAACETLRQVLGALGPDYRKDHLAPTRIIVRIDRFRQARHFVANQAHQWNTGRGPHVFIASIGKTQLTAQALAQRIAEHDAPRRVILVGNSNLADAFADEWEYQRAAAAFLQDAAERALGGSGGREETLDTPLRKMISLQKGKADLPDLERRERIPELEELRRLQQDPGVTVIMIALDRSEFRLRSLEKSLEQYPAPNVLIYVPDPRTQGIGSVPMLGSLVFYGPSLGGFERGSDGALPLSGPEPVKLMTEDPLLGVPQDSWFRAAKLISDGYNIEAGPNTWEEQSSEEKESNFRALWFTLRQVTDQGYDWASSHLHREYQVPLTDADFDAMVRPEHESWLAFKRHHGWVGVKGANNDRYLENGRAHTWDDLQTAECLASNRAEAIRLTGESLRFNVRALEALGFRPDRRGE